MIIYFNPDCSKCNEALALLKGQKCSVDIRNYLQDPPTVEELRDLLKKLRCKATDLVRTTEPLFREKYGRLPLNEEEWLKVLASNPILIERPIVISGENAIIGRPPELVLTLAANQASKGM